MVNSNYYCQVEYCSIETFLNVGIRVFFIVKGRTGAHPNVMMGGVEAVATPRGTAGGVAVVVGHADTSAAAATGRRGVRVIWPAHV